MSEDIETLRDGVSRALAAIPALFESGLSLSGVPATDLCGAQSLVSSGVEREVTDKLNKIRHIWDPDGKFLDCVFKRFPESFPDVRLVRDGCSEPVIGIELKSWYLLSKEQEPSARFKASVRACAEGDLLAIFPWHFSEVVTGEPVLLAPWVASARETAQARNEAWDGVVVVADTHPYPPPRSLYCDRPVVSNSGWGRISRCASLGDFVDSTLDSLLSGIPARYWISFLSLFKESAQEDAIRRGLERIASEVCDDSVLVGDADLSEISDHLFSIVRLIRD